MNFLTLTNQINITNKMGANLIDKLLSAGIKFKLF